MKNTPPTRSNIVVLKQSLKLGSFLGHSANAVRWQIYTALLVYVLLRFMAHDWLQAAGRNQSELATLGGVNPANVSRWLSGQSKPDKEVIGNRANIVTRRHQQITPLDSEVLVELEFHATGSKATGTKRSWDMAAP